MVNMTKVPRVNLSKVAVFLPPTTVRHNPAALQIMHGLKANNVASMSHAAMFFGIRT